MFLVLNIIFRLNFTTPFSSNVLSICKSINLNFVKRLEKSTRYLIIFIDYQKLTSDFIDQVFFYINFLNILIYL